MNLFREFFDSDWSQRNDIDALDERARRIEEKLYGGGGDVSDLRRDVARLVLVVQALSDILVSKRVCTREEFLGLMDRIDAADGSPDGRIGKAAPPPQESEEFGENPELRLCRRCNQNNPSTALSCIHCGATMGEA